MLNVYNTKANIWIQITYFSSYFIKSFIINTIIYNSISKKYNLWLTTHNDNLNKKNVYTINLL